MTRGSEKSTIVLAMGITIAGGLPVFLLAALFTEISDEISVPRWALGALVATYWLFAAMGSVLAGLFTAVFGARKVMMLTLLAAIVSLLGAAFFVPTWHWLALWMASGGTANGTCHPPTNHLMRVRIAPKRHAIAFGFKQSAIPFATLVSGLAIPLVALTLGWRWAFAMMGGCTIVLLIAFLLWSRGRFLTDDKARTTKSRLGRPLTSFFVTLAVSTTLGAGGASIVAAYGVIFAVDRGIDVGTAGFMLGLASIIGALMRIAAGVITSSVKRDALKLMAVMQMVGGTGIFLMMSDGQWTYAVGLTIAFGIGWGWPGLVHFSASRIAGPSTPAATSIVQTGTFIGCAAGPLLAGAVDSASGSQTVWLLSAVLLISAGCIALTLSKQPSHSIDQPLA